VAKKGERSHADLAPGLGTSCFFTRGEDYGNILARSPRSGDQWPVRNGGEGEGPSRYLRIRLWDPENLKKLTETRQAALEGGSKKLGSEVLE